MKSTESERKKNQSRTEKFQRKGVIGKNFNSPPECLVKRDAVSITIVSRSMRGGKKWTWKRNLEKNGSRNSEGCIKRGVQPVYREPDFMGIIAVRIQRSVAGKNKMLAKKEREKVLNDYHKGRLSSLSKKNHTTMGEL